MSHFDTIVAPITGGGVAAVAVVRVSGPEAWRVASQVFTPWDPAHLKAVHGRYVHGDDGLALPFADGHSYTGEEAVELSTHGSSASVRLLIDACVAAGARMAEPGEFTQRAFLNGRLDLTQAESVRDTIEARTETQFRLANLQREGSLRRRIDSLRKAVTSVLAAVEASVDFSEEIGELDRRGAAKSLESAAREIRLLLETAGTSRILRNGLRVAIVGPPNAGKSSLLNAILGTDRAIVTEIPGTTRDFVEEQIEVDGFPVVLIDTAGLRESTDRIESIGIQRSRTIASGADHLWYIFDASLGWSPEDESARASLGTLASLSVVANKSDLVASVEHPGLPVSAKTGSGIAVLLKSLPIDRDIAYREISINPRHSRLLSSAHEALQSSILTLGSNRPTDMVSVLLQETLYALGQVTGETASPDMISQIFADFCIGK